MKSALVKKYLSNEFLPVRDWACNLVCPRGILDIPLKVVDQRLGDSPFLVFLHPCCRKGIDRCKEERSEEERDGDLDNGTQHSEIVEGCMKSEPRQLHALCCRPR